MLTHWTHTHTATHTRTYAESIESQLSCAIAMYVYYTILNAEMHVDSIYIQVMCSNV